MRPNKLLTAEIVSRETCARSEFGIDGDTPVPRGWHTNPGYHGVSVTVTYPRGDRVEWVVEDEDTPSVFGELVKVNETPGREPLLELELSLHEHSAGLPW